MTKTIEQEALDLINEVRAEYGHKALTGPQAVARYGMAITDVVRAEREAHAAFRQEVSDAVEEWVTADRRGPEPRRRASENLTTFIIPKPKPDPLVEVAREMVLLDGVVRTDNQKAAIREGRAANTAADDFYDRLRAALAARGLKLVEAGDAAA